MLHHPDRPNQLRREPELATEVVEELLVDEGSKDGPVLLPVTVGGSACRKTSNAQEMILPALTRLRKCFESVTPRGSTATGVVRVRGPVVGSSIRSLPM